MDEATRTQIHAASPRQSTWLTANAGSGKTRVLTDRVARLLLAGTLPERILCLTYTKAAATEMQNRLLDRLGGWAMMPEAKLREALEALGENDLPDLAQARRLFARAIETPGGLKVQTIHSFCAAILRRFPLEAGVPIGFSELDDRSATLMRAEIIEQMADEPHPSIADLTMLHSGHELDRFLSSLSEADYALAPDPMQLWSAFDLPPDFDDACLLDRVFSGDEADLFDNLIPLMSKSNATDQKLAAAWQGIDWRNPDPTGLDILIDTLLTKDGRAKTGKVPAVGLQRGAAAGLIDSLNALIERVCDVRPYCHALALARRSLALHRFAHEFTKRYQTEKAAHGWLDFDDLITRTARLMSSSSMAQWVLWRLDGGIDHILVDEAQDTSPGQWQVIRAMTEEFTSGAGAREEGRTLFVVGDPKQSIYSFQGADVAVFDQMRQQFDDDFRAVESPMNQSQLRHSFRSSPAILKLVDDVFQGEAAQGLGQTQGHIAHHEALPGRIDIWPAVPKAETAEPGPWWQPLDTIAPNDATSILAEALAKQIEAMIGTPIYDIRSRQKRAIGPGDILILVQRRSDLFHAIIGACKARNLAIAGTDRLKLAAELAVRDIRAVLDFVATPEDDLSLAAALRSPLFGLSEDQLYRLSAGRKGFLWTELRQSGHTEVMTIIDDLMRQADFMRPYDLVSRLLIRHGGRARLLARLGPEAEDGIAELISQSLAYESVEPPSLTGFLTWLTGGDIEVKRQLGGAGGGMIRVMTVHGSKGLESPVVILPDTAKRRPPNPPMTIALDGRQVLRGQKDARTERLAAAVDEAALKAEHERQRLLYVGLTRAESWLIVAAAGETGDETESWYNMVSQGAACCQLDREDLDIPGLGTGLRLSHGEWTEFDDQDVSSTPADKGWGALPDWADRPAARLERPALPVAATSLGGAKIIGGETAEGTREDSMLRGTRLHLLLEVLDGIPPSDHHDTAIAALAGSEGGLPDKRELNELLQEAQAVFEAPDLEEVMSPEGMTILREVELTASLPWLGILHGTVDRLLVGTDHVMAIDYKSNRDVPDRPEDVPEGILRQMLAYRQALQTIYPTRRIKCAVLWTATRSLMALPDTVLAQTEAALDPDRHGS